MWGDRQINHMAERQREGGSVFVWRTRRGWIICLTDVCWYGEAAAAALATAEPQHLAGGHVGRAEGGSGRGPKWDVLASGLTSMRVKWHSLFNWAAAVKCSEGSRQTKSIGIDCPTLCTCRYIHPTNPQEPQHFLFSSVFSHPFKEQVKHLPRHGGNWCLCCGSILSLSLSWHVCLPQL